jgi:hypothetical protein
MTQAYTKAKGSAAPPRLVSGEEAAMALVPSMTFLVHEAHRAGLDEISDMLTQTLANMTRWIEEQGHEQNVG